MQQDGEGWQDGGRAGPGCQIFPARLVLCAAFVLVQQASNPHFITCTEYQSVGGRKGANVNMFQELAPRGPPSFAFIPRLLFHLASGHLSRLYLVYNPRGPMWGLQSSPHCHTNPCACSADSAQRAHFLNRLLEAPPGNLLLISEWNLISPNSSLCESLQERVLIPYIHVLWLLICRFPQTVPCPWFPVSLLCYPFIIAFLNGPGARWMTSASGC